MAITPTILIPNAVLEVSTGAWESLFPWIKKIVSQSQDFKDHCIIEENRITTTQQVALKILKKAQLLSSLTAAFYDPKTFLFMGGLAFKASYMTLPYSDKGLDPMLHNIASWMQTALLILSLILIYAGWSDTGELQQFGLATQHTIWRTIDQQLRIAIETVSNRRANHLNPDEDPRRSANDRDNLQISLSFENTLLI